MSDRCGDVYSAGVAAMAAAGAALGAMLRAACLLEEVESIKGDMGVPRIPGMEG